MTKVSSLPKTNTISENDNVVISTSAGKTQLASTNALASTISGGTGFVVEKKTSFYNNPYNNNDLNSYGTVAWCDPSSAKIYVHAYSLGGLQGGTPTELPAGAVILGIWPYTTTSK